MKILVFTHYYMPEIGAPQRRWAAMVSRWQRAGHQVTVCCPAPHYPDKVSSADFRTSANSVGTVSAGEFGETIVRVPYLLHGFSGKVRALDQLLSATASALYAVGTTYTGKNKFDVVIATVPGVPSLLAGRITSLLTNTPLVAEMRDAWPDVVTGDLRSQVARISIPKRIFKKSVYTVVTAMQRHAAAVVTTTNRFAKVLHERGIQPVAVIANGADSTEFTNMPAVQPVPGELKILYLGTIGRSQGLETALEALDILRTLDPRTSYRLRIVGDGALKKDLQQQAAERSLNVEFLPVQPRTKLGEIYKWADTSLVTLRGTKPFEWTVPSKIYELLATGRYLVAAVRGEAADIVKASGGGTVVSPGAPMELAHAWYTLANHQQLLKVDETPARYLAFNNDYDVLATKYEQVLSAIVEKEGS